MHVVDAKQYRKHACSHGCLHEKADGVFAKNASLKKFLVSPPVIAAGLHIQHGFEVLHNADACRQIIENYAALGGDDGLTEKTMRGACGLKERDRRLDPAPGARIHILDDEAPSMGPSQTADDSLKTVAKLIMGKCIAEGRDFYTLKMLKRLALPAEAPNVDRETLWKRLEDEKLFVSVVRSGSKARDSMRPAPSFALGLSKVIDVKPSERNHDFVDQYNVSAFTKYLHGSPWRFTNAALLQDYYTAHLDFLRKPRRGKRSNADKAEIDSIQQRLDKYRFGESRAQAIDSTLSAGPSTRPSKRLRHKHSEEVRQDDMVEISMAYHCTLGSVIRTRRHSDVSGAQGCPRIDDYAAVVYSTVVM